MKDFFVRSAVIRKGGIKNAGRRACTKGTYRTGKPHNMNWGQKLRIVKTVAASAQKQRRKP